MTPATEGFNLFVYRSYFYNQESKVEINFNLINWTEFNKEASPIQINQRQRKVETL